MTDSNEDQDMARQLNQKKLHQWCLARISILSLRGHDHEAQAVTEEHMEMLKETKSETTFWMRTEQRLHEEN